MPPATLAAVADHGTVPGASAELDHAADLEALADAGIDMDQVTDELLTDGIRLFQEAMAKLLDGIEQRRLERPRRRVLDQELNAVAPGSAAFEVSVVDDPVAACAQAMVAAARGRRGAQIVLSGGSSPRAVYELAAREPDAFERRHVLVRR